jgi:hypothetical protein
MKRILRLSILLLPVIFVACTNHERFFPDYTTQAVYFPIQFPIRTLVMGESRYDNSIDLEHAFNFGISIGGLYQNSTNWTVNYVIDPTLVTNVVGKSSKNETSQLKVLPREWYAIENEGSLTIPSGSMNGKAKVMMKDEFFTDTAGYKFRYVLPLRIVNTSAPAILTGTPLEGVTNGDRLKPGDWQKLPMDYVLFAVKYINTWHGSYFRRGQQLKDGVVDKVFHKQDLEQNPVSYLTTTGYKTATYGTMGDLTTGASLSKLTFTDDVAGIGNITISSMPGSPYTVIEGSGKYYKKNTAFAAQYGSWLLDPATGKPEPHLTMTLNFKVSGIVPGITHQYVDTLVFRDNGLTFESFNAERKP